jgi:protein NrfC
MKDRESQKGRSCREVLRRDFLKFAGTTVVVMGGRAFASSNGVLVKQVMLAVEEKGVPPSEGYLLVDTKKCQGCVSCMLACSLVHEGVESLSLSRIQVLQNSFEKWPDDVTFEPCRQCVDPACVEACPEGALEANPEYGYVRMVDRDKCIGCLACVEACPHTPSRSIVAPDREYNGEEKSRKCDLCAHTPYHWDENGGGPYGKQACVEVCPVGAIQFTRQAPQQHGDAGYQVNLRGESWRKLGYPTY